MQSSYGWDRPLVVGASGQVGVELSRELRERGSGAVLRSRRTGGDGWITLDLAALRDGEDAAAVLDAHRPDLILCVGAMTYVDGCEDQPKLAFLTNAHGPSALAAYARQLGVPFVFFSSDYVFDGVAETPGPYAETAPTHPLSVYGRSKLQGEQAVLRVYPEALVVRTTWVYGPDAAGKNFVSSLLRQLRAGERVRVPADQVSTPTFNRDLAAATLDLVAAGAQGVVHVAGEELMSRLELAQEIARFFGLPEELVQGEETRALGQKAARPLRSGLRSERLSALLPEFRMRSLAQGLQETAALLQG